MKRARTHPGDGADPTTPHPRPLVWPGSPEGVTAADVDFAAIAHVLAHTCRWGGRTRQFLSLAQHAVAVSEEVEGLDGVTDAERRTLALHGLLASAPAAWLGDAADPASTRAAERHRRHTAAVERAVREAAGLPADLPPEWATLLGLVARMVDAAERRDLGVEATAAGVAFPPARRRVRPVAPAKAARRWLARFEALTAPPASGAAVPETSSDRPDTIPEGIPDAA